MFSVASGAVVVAAGVVVVGSGVVVCSGVGSVVGFVVSEPGAATDSMSVEPVYAAS